MSTGKEDVCGGGQDGPSGVVLGGIEAIIPIASHLVQYAAGLDGKLSPESAIHISLRKTNERRELLEQVIAEICPTQADEDLWRNWISGEGVSPFQLRMKQPGNGDERPAQTLARASDKVKSHTKKIEKAQAKVDAATAELEQAQRLLLECQNLESAALHWHVVSQLVGIVRPVFAMGPAWTVMRALSSHISEQTLSNRTVAYFGKQKEDVVAFIKGARVAETQLMLEVLDLGSGNEEFEDSLRAAMLQVCKDWNKKREKLTADGRKPRSSERVKVEVHPKARADADEVLEGLKQAS